jgi:hypothetical protein
LARKRQEMVGARHGCEVADQLSLASRRSHSGHGMASKVICPGVPPQLEMEGAFCR